MAAAVGTARVTFPMVVVMITPDIGVEVQFACYQCFCCCISVAGNTTIKPDTHIAQCHPVSYTHLTLPTKRIV